MADKRPTIHDIDKLLSGATPHFSQQLKARVWNMIEDLPRIDEVRQYGEKQMKLLDHMAFGTTRGIRKPGVAPANDEGWNELPSHPKGSPLGKVPQTPRA